MEAWQPQSTESPLTPINIYSGTAIMPYPTNTASSAHYYTGPKTSAPTNNYWKKNKQKKQRALSTCKYPDWAINRMKLKIGAPKTRNNNSNRNSKTTYRGHITVPYNEGLSKSMKNICKRYGIQAHFKSGKT